MNLRGVYVKVVDMEKCLTFYEGLFGKKATALQPDYYEFSLDNGKFGVSLNNYGDKYQPSSAVPTFYMSEEQAVNTAEKAKELGGKMVFNGMADPKMKCIIYADPCGNEIEFNALPWDAA